MVREISLEVREKSGKSQGILFSHFCGNPEKERVLVTDVKHMGVIGNLLINYLNFFHKKGDTIGEGGGGQDKKRVFAAEHTCTGHILECPPPRMSSRIYIFTNILRRSFFTYLTNWWHFHVTMCYF